MGYVVTRLSKRLNRLARAAKRTRLYTTIQVAERLSVRSMTLMRWVANGKIACPKAHMANPKGLHWLWNEGDIRRARAFKKAMVGSNGYRVRQRSAGAFGDGIERGRNGETSMAAIP
jgi:hypothetical protein